MIIARTSSSRQGFGLSSRMHPLRFTPVTRSASSGRRMVPARRRCSALWRDCAIRHRATSPVQVASGTCRRRLRFPSSNIVTPPDWSVFSPRAMWAVCSGAWKRPGIVWKVSTAKSATA